MEERKVLGKLQSIARALTDCANVTTGKLNRELSKSYEHLEEAIDICMALPKPSPRCRKPGKVISHLRLVKSEKPKAKPRPKKSKQTARSASS